MSEQPPRITDTAPLPRQVPHPAAGTHRGLGLSAKITLLLAVLSTIAFAVVTAFNYTALREKLVADLSRYADVTVERLANTLPTPAWNMDLETVKAIVAAELDDPHLREVVVRETGDHILFRAARPAESGAQSFEGGAVDIVRRREFAMGTGSTGTVEVHVTTRLMQDELAANLMNSLARVVLFEAFLVGAIFLMLRRLVIRPLAGLAGVAQEISRTKDFSLRAGIRADDEIGRLALSLNTMLDELESLNTTVTRHAESLEATVAQRTSELTESNERLSRLNAELAEATKAANQASEAKSAFLANMSHEIRTPMNAILGVTELFATSPLSSRQKEYLDIIRSSAQSLLGIISDILDVSKIEAGKLALERIPFDLADLIEETASMFMDTAGRKKLDFVVDIPPEVPSALIGDPLRLKQVLVNLLANAFKFTEAGTVCLQARVAERGSDLVRIAFTVEDTGIGIAAETLKRLFTPFTQADGSTTRRFGGTGLGLALSKRIVRLYDGDFTVDSVPGKGSTFRFTALFGLRHDVPSRDAPPLPPELAGAGALVVDDSPVSRFVAQRLLTELGFAVESAESAEEALEALRAAPALPRLVLMDWRLPGMNGLAASKEIAAAFGRDAPKVILVTAFDKDLDASEASAETVARVLAKPLRKRALIQVVAEVFGFSPPGEGGAEAAASDGAARASGGAAWAGFTGVNALLAEDNPLNRRVAREILERTGMRLTLAADGQEAVDLCRESVYDIVYLDVGMPRLDGYGAARAIRALPGYRLIPLVALTAHVMDEERERALAAGLDGFVPKPITPPALYKLSAELLGRTPPPDGQPLGPAGSEGLHAGLPGFDVAEGLERLAGNVDLYLELLGDFAEGYTDYAARIREAVGHGDLATARDLAHALKGAAGNISACAAGREALAVETAAREGDAEELAQALDRLGSVLFQIKAAIDALLAESGPASGQPRADA